MSYFVIVNKVAKHVMVTSMTKWSAEDTAEAITSTSLETAARKSIGLVVEVSLKQYCKIEELLDSGWVTYTVDLNGRWDFVKGQRVDVSEDLWPGGYYISPLAA